MDETLVSEDNDVDVSMMINNVELKKKMQSKIAIISLLIAVVSKKMKTK